jgi:hypothetical protein
MAVSAAAWTLSLAETVASSRRNTASSAADGTSAEIALATASML